VVRRRPAPPPATDHPFLCLGGARQFLVVKFCAEIPMTKVESLEEEITKLSPVEFAELREWLLEKDWEQWDRQIERDADDGKLDALFDEAHRAHVEGKSTKF
jgi:hypothetical protein